MLKHWWKRLPKSGSRPARARLGVEALETRLVPSFTTNLVNGQLQVTGDGTGNIITLDHSGGNTLVIDRTGNIVAGFGDAQITAGISIKSGSGNDTVNIRAAAEPVTLDGVNGLDTVTVGKGGNMQAIRAPVKIINPAGRTALNLDDSN